MRGAGNPDEEQIHFLFAPKDEKITETIQHLADLQRAGDEKGMEQWGKKYPGRLWIKRDVEGIVQTGMRTNEHTNKEVARLQDHLDPDFVVLDDDKPDPEMGTFLYRAGIGIYAVLGAILGLLLLIWLTRVLVSRRARS